MAKKDTPPYWRRVEFNPRKRYNGHVAHTFEFSEPFTDVQVIALQGGTIVKADYSKAKDGKLLLTFSDTATYIRAFHLHGGKP